VAQLRPATSTSGPCSRGTAWFASVSAAMSMRRSTRRRLGLLCYWLTAAGLWCLGRCDTGASPPLPPPAGYTCRNGACVEGTTPTATQTPSPPPPPSVIVGDIRVQALSSDVFRVERRGPRGFEDSPTFLIKQRDLQLSGTTPIGKPVVGAGGHFNVSVGSGATAVLLQVTPQAQDATTCFVMRNVKLFPTKAAGPSVPARDEGDCCAACDANPNCTSWLYSGKPSIYKQTGAEGSSPPSSPPPAHPNCQLNKGYGEQHLGGSTFGCPRRGCDATWSGRWQGGDLGASYRQPPLQMHVTVYELSTGMLLGSSDDASAPFNFPAPSDPVVLDAPGGVLALRDSPRFLVPEGGAIPHPDVEAALHNTSGYDIRNDADDVYLLLSRANYTRLKQDFLRLTGPIPLLPDWSYGIWFTEWHGYTQSVAEAEMQRWRIDKLPLSFLKPRFLLHARALSQKTQSVPDIITSAPDISRSARCWSSRKT
jgi:hypothetical protein